MREILGYPRELFPEGGMERGRGQGQEESEQAEAFRQRSHRVSVKARMSEGAELLPQRRHEGVVVADIIAGFTSLEQLFQLMLDVFHLGFGVWARTDVNCEFSMGLVVPDTAVVFA